MITLVLVMVLGGGAPEPAPGGLPDAGPVMAWVQSMLSLLTRMAATVTVGFAWLGGGYLTSTPVTIQTGALRIAVAMGAVWAGLVLIAAGLTVIELRIESVQLASQGIGASLASPQARPLLIELVMATATSVTALRSKSRWLPFPIALLAVIGGAIVGGHVLTAPSPVLAGAVLGIHVAAVSLWVGGLVAVGWLALKHSDAWLDVLPRYSRVALGSILALALSGIVSALQQIELGQVWESAYGIVVTLKVLMILALALFGWAQRRRVIGRGSARLRDFLLLAGAELTLMVITFGIAVGLATTPTPN
ncbi:MAG: hypothetical protein GEU79_04605 [Acidimicrobiia bacterium]|nr:hypothetical protein [Acidimicrobiia bacterium]